MYIMFRTTIYSHFFSIKKSKCNRNFTKGLSDFKLVLVGKGRFSK